MARQKTPLYLAELTGTRGRNPGRFKGRVGGHDLAALGSPPEWLTGPQRAVWRDLAADLPWLRASDRAVTASTCLLICKMRDDKVPSSGLVKELRAHLSALGATPVDRQRIVWQAPPDKPDPADEFLN